MIDYQILANSITFYADKGFKRIEAPWTVSEKVDDITKPADRIHFQLKHNDKCLVASGEQSFLYLMVKGFLPEGKYQTITPCFRYEAFDAYHTKYFMKNELIQTDDVSKRALGRMLEEAAEFYEGYFGKTLSIIKTTEGFDIELGGHELGSYGIRKHEYISWIYGTGCAEPRMSNLLKLR
jgi:hypothetical protein